MSVAEKRIRLTLEDRFSQSFKNAQSSVRGFDNSLQGLSTGMKNLNTSSESAFRTLTKFSGLYKALGTLGNVFGGSIGQVVDYAKSFETNAVGISGILTSMSTLNGKTLEWNQSMAISKDVMAQLRVMALQTAATSTDLVDTFRALLGPGLGAGMSIKEIMEFTKVGVNAVKSMGLPTNQYIQELRGLEQGGIRASSSTLATALGLKDADIEAAKNSSEGLFKFLMKRLEGFQRATGETSKTLEGQIEIAKEAMLAASAEAGNSVLNTYSQTLSKINSMLLIQNEGTGLFEVNPEIVSKLESFASVIDTVISKMVDFGMSIGSNFSFLMWDMAAFIGIPKIVDLISGTIGSIVTKLGQAKTLIAEKKNKEEEFAQVAKKVLADEDKVISAKRKIAEQGKIIEKSLAAVNKENFNYSSMVDAIKNKLKQLGLSEIEINNRVISQLNLIKEGRLEEAQAINVVINKLVQEKAVADAAKISFWQKTQNAIGAASQFTGALSSVGFALMAVTDADNEFTQSLSKGLFAFDATISAAGSLSTAISGLAQWWGTLEAATKSCYLTMSAGLGVLTVAAAVAYSAYDKYQHAARGGKFKYNDLGEVYYEPDSDWSDRLGDDDYGYDWQNTPDYNKNLQLKYPKVPEVKGAGGGAAKQDKTAENIAKYKELMTTVRNSTEALNTNQSAYDKTMNSAEKQLDTWNKTLVKLSESGALSEEELKKAKELMGVYYSEMTEKAKQEQDKQNLNLIKAHTEQAKLTMELGRGNQQEEYNRVNESLQTHKEYLEKMLENQKLSAEERINIEKEYAATVKAIRDNDMLDYKKSWKAVLEELSQRQINYGDSIKSVFSSIESAGVSLLTSTKSFGEGIKTFFQDVTSSILAEMAKIIMKGLVTNAILSIFGMGGSGKSIGMGVGTGSIGSYNTSNILKTSVFQAANGGVQQGWGIVGERGPELVNFSNPGRVYTADQTRNALSGGGQVNIKIDLKNESGQQMQAETTGTQFDGESYVVGVVLKAIATNKSGLRTVLRGV